MNNETIFITDESKLHLSSGDLFDRIINLKLTCYNVETDERESFVIRSDYEMVYPDSSLPVDGNLLPYLKNRCVIRRCTMKPSIKVQCKMVSTNTGISTEVFVSNFFMLTKDGKHLRSFNNSQYNIETVEIAMGYWGQFRIGEESDQLVPSYDDYFEIKAKNGADKLTLTGAIVVTTDKLPPDSVLHIKGYVANIFSSPIAVSNVDTVDKAVNYPIASSGEGFEQILFNNITRRYLNKHYFTDGEGAGIPRSKKNIKVSEIETFGVPVVYDKVSGMMSETDAEKYGVKVYLSNQAKKIEIPKMLDSDGNEVDKVFYFESGWTIGQTIARIMSFMSADLNFTYNKNGDVLIYTTDEVNEPETLYNSFFEEGMYENTVLSNKSLYDNKLPAVYNINVDAVATIVCPFFTFFEPFQYIEFASRYALTSVVSYFASYSPTVYKFLVINASISFATVDDVNEVHITAVSSREAKAN